VTVYADLETSDIISKNLNAVNEFIGPGFWIFEARFGIIYYSPVILVPINNKSIKICDPINGKSHQAYWALFCQK
jgi:hypothetical protein